MMNKFEKILPYVSILQRVDGDYIVIVNFRKEWTVESDEKQHVNAQWSDDYESWVYMAHENEVSFEALCDYIQYTIDVNKEAEAKTALFEKKKKELTDLFKEKSLLELEGLNFNIMKNTVNVGYTAMTPASEETKTAAGNDVEKKKGKK